MRLLLLSFLLFVFKGAIISFFMQGYTRIEGTQIEFLCPAEFSFDNGCYSSGELKAGICFNVMDDKSEQSIAERSEKFEKENMVRRIPINTILDCTDLFC